MNTTVRPTGHRPVPIAFGWHPYLQLDSAPRREWTLRLPARQHLALDERGLPTGGRSPEPSDRELELLRTKVDPGRFLLGKAG